VETREHLADMFTIHFLQLQPFPLHLVVYAKSFVLVEVAEGDILEMIMRAAAVEVGFCILIN
jgi:hypothetical protein